ncbi:MAG: cupin domain-containing protein [Ignavibacteria bacterium]|jgi:mannose-6-phosphate isomerase-like protein (cupin superfamily)
MNKIKLEEKFALFTEHWTPKIISELNDQYIKLAKVKGEFVWHNHKDEDELFFIIKGKLLMKFRDKEIELNEGKMIVVPKGVDHMPVAEKECRVMLIEPKSTKHTGEVKHKLTKENLERI